MRNIWLVFLMTILSMSACAPALNPTPTLELTKETPAMPDLPSLDDLNSAREPVFIEEHGLLIRESFPPQIALGLSGNLPSPCHQLRSEVSPPEAENRINVEVYSAADPTMNCTQVLSPFMETIELSTFPSGHYSVWLNGDLVEEFDA